jgi:hypothetical protein
MRPVEMRSTTPANPPIPEVLEAFPTEQAAIDHLTAVRWANGVYCPICGSTDAARIRRLNQGGAPSNIHKCYACNRRFSIKVGTIFENTKLPLRVWYAAIWIAIHRPKGLVALTLAEELEITPNNAWYIRHCLRRGVASASFNAPLSDAETQEAAAIDAPKRRDKNRASIAPRSRAMRGRL